MWLVVAAAGGVGALIMVQFAADAWGWLGRDRWVDAVIVSSHRSGEDLTDVVVTYGDLRAHAPEVSGGSHYDVGDTITVVFDPQSAACRGDAEGSCEFQTPHGAVVEAFLMFGAATYLVVCPLTCVMLAWLDRRERALTPASYAIAWGVVAVLMFVGTMGAATVYEVSQGIWSV